MKGTVVVGVCGSVAAYRAADTCRELMRRGFVVRVCLSRSAEGFVTRALFEALTGGPALTDVFDEPIRGRMAHIDWAREASCVLVCPATANAIATLANGEADDMFSTLVTATKAPLVIAPAMNPQMYASDSNRENMRVLAKRGAVFVEPAEGDVACGENGQGKLASIERIVEAVESAALRSNLLTGKTIMITAGPTREPLDPVRYLSNRSSGRMGFALARAALSMGANVTIISGPTHEIAPPAANVVSVETAEQMLAAALESCASADMLIGAAAVADFRPRESSTKKIKKSDALPIELVQNPDLLSEVRKANKDLTIIAFAAETDKHEENALAKLQAKNVQAIVVNDVSRDDIGFDSQENEGTMLFADGRRVDLPKDSKINVATRILEAAADLLK